MGYASVAPGNFLDMFEGSLLPQGFYRNRGGVWLTLDMTTVESSGDANQTHPLKYHGHNEEHPEDRLWLLRAFAAWATGARTLLDWA